MEAQNADKPIKKNHDARGESCSALQANAVRGPKELRANLKSPIQKKQPRSATGEANPTRQYHRTRTNPNPHPKSTGSLNAIQPSASNSTLHQLYTSIHPNATCTTHPQSLNRLEPYVTLTTYMRRGEWEQNTPLTLEPQKKHE